VSQFVSEDLSLAMWLSVIVDAGRVRVMTSESVSDSDGLGEAEGAVLRERLPMDLPRSMLLGE